MKLTFLLLLLIACSSPKPKTAQINNSDPSPGLEKNFLKGDSRVGTYTSSHKGFMTSSYWIEGPEGVVVIDLQFLLSASEEFLNLVEAQTKKKVVLAIVLHPNPDKFNGTSVFQKRGIRVITSKSVAQHIPVVYQLRRKWFYERFKPEFPETEPKPEIEGSIPDKGMTELKVAGLNLKLHGMGKGCSYSHLVVEWEEHLFVGDLVTNGFHAWLEHGYVDEWIKRIEERQELEPEFVHPGRGPGGGDELLERQHHYLTEVKRLAKKAKNSEQFTESVLERFPGYSYSNFVKLGAENCYKSYH